MAQGAIVVALLAAVGAATAFAQAEPIANPYAAALQRVSPCVVRIDAIGGAAPAADESGRPAFDVAAGPSTGVIWSADGEIVTSSFNFVREPTVIIAVLADGRQFVARRVATDHVTRLTLLRVDADGLPTPALAPRENLRVGQTVLAVGRGHGGAAPTITTGVLSALRRMNGLALQTDANTSPANYGGPLCDRDGRVNGVIAPLGPGEDALAGARWYDSGIGFAIDAALVSERVARLRGGEDLRRGYLGVTLDRRRPVNAAPTTQPASAGLEIIAPPTGPAAEAGLQAGDRIIAIDDEPTPTSFVLGRLLMRRVAGDMVKLTFERGGERRTARVTLADGFTPPDPNDPNHSQERP